MLELPDFASNSDPGPGKLSPGSGDILEMLDFVSAREDLPGVRGYISNAGLR